ncbi:MAG: thiamine diphosphokinase [Oscillospiraceae bacterium]|nr:thiamine diphosphokinase [Oscillospiraceae bacterium]
MPVAYIFCPSNILNQKKINIPVSCDNGNIYIAADSGILTAEKLNIKPNVVIGDFDSVDLSSLKIKYKDIKTIKYPAEKDDTDLMLAVKYSLESGYKNIKIIGGLDGRIDHTLANIYYLKYIKIHGGGGYITNGYNKISYISNSSVKIYKNYKYISVIPVNSVIHGLTLKNFKYSLDNAIVKFEEPYTVCNEILKDFKYGEIIISDGEVLICECDDILV